MVQKASSWALRNAIAHDRRGVRAFLTRHAMPFRHFVRREVTRKLTTGRENL